MAHSGLLNRRSPPGHPQLEKLETSGFEASTSATLAFQKMAAKCPGDPCKGAGTAMKGKLGEALKKRVGEKKKAIEITAAQKDKILSQLSSILSGDVAHQKMYDAYQTPDYERGSNPGLERLRNLTAELIELERGGDADAAQFVEQDFEVVKQPKVRTVYRSSAGRRPSHVVSELVGWEEVVVPVGAPTDQAVGLERERALGSFSGTVSGSMAESDKGSSSFEQSSESTKIISLGAPPAGDVMEWAQNAHVENMPINYQVRCLPPYGLPLACAESLIPPPLPRLLARVDLPAGQAGSRARLPGRRRPRPR